MAAKIILSDFKKIVIFPFLHIVSEKTDYLSYHNVMFYNLSKNEEQNHSKFVSELHEVHLKNEELCGKF